MKKIGLFLSTKIEDGGVHQYSLSILHAFLELPTEIYDKVIFYVSYSWKDELSQFDINSKFINFNFLTKLFLKIFRQIQIKNKVTKKLLNLILPLRENNELENCDLLIFPAQDQISYFLNTQFISPIHDLMHRYEKSFPEVYENGQFRKREIRYRNISKWASGILTDSNVGKTHVMESYMPPEELVFVLPYTIPNYISQYKTNQTIDITSKYKLPAKYFFYPANFWTHKNHLNLLKAFEILLEKFADMCIVFVGSKKNNSSMVEDYVQTHKLVDKVITLGYVPDEEMFYFYQGAVALILPTFFGPTNIPPLEAIYAGCPMAISDIYGMRERFGSVSLFFNPNDVTDIMVQMEKLWLDKSLKTEILKKYEQYLNEWNVIKFNKYFNQIVSNTCRGNK